MSKFVSFDLISQLGQCISLFARMTFLEFDYAWQVPDDALFDFGTTFDDLRTEN